MCRFAGDKFSFCLAYFIWKSSFISHFIHFKNISIKYTLEVSSYFSHVLNYSIFQSLPSTRILDAVLTMARYVFLLYYYFCNSIMKCLSMVSFKTSFGLLGLKFMVTSGKGSGIVSSRMASVSSFAPLELQLDAYKDYPLSSYLHPMIIVPSALLLAS